MKWRGINWLIPYLLLMVLAACHDPVPLPQAEASSQTDDKPMRIISLAPSITEILFELGLDERIVGVTQFCKYPAEATTRTSVGGYYNPNYEAMVALKPDLVVLLKEHSTERAQFKELGIHWLEVNNRSVADILASIERIGKKTGTGEAAARLSKTLTTKLDHISQITKDLPRPKVLVSVGRNMGNGTVKDTYVAGKRSLFNELITLAGGQNAYSERGRDYPVISAEGLLLLNPDVVIDMVPHRTEKGQSAEAVRAEWQALPKLSAVKSNRVFVFDQDYVTIPGPRIFLLLEQMARAIHPEQFPPIAQGGAP